MSSSPPKNTSKYKSPWGIKIVWMAIGLLIGGIGLWLGIRWCGWEISEKVIEPFQLHNDHVFGIDVSHYQHRIDWDEVRTSHHPIEYVIVRATMGHDGRDNEFHRNWKEAKRKGFLRGAYHYYRPHENSKEQFDNFCARVKLETGDLPPILDIEEMSQYGVENLREGIANWLRLAESHFGVKPIVYTGRTFYHAHLKGHIEEYPLWIASYSGKHKLNGIDWTFHQFTERVKVKGISGTVDGNDFNGTHLELQKLCVGYTSSEHPSEGPGIVPE